jgi:hypothetical protein
MSQVPITNPEDLDQDWDELYATEAARSAMPPEPKPEPPRRRRIRRWAWWSVGAVFLSAGAAAGFGFLVTQSSLRLLTAIGASDGSYLESHVDWPDLQRGLRDDLLRFAREAQVPSLTTAAPAASTQSYLNHLIETTVSAQRRPERLARVVDERVFPGRGSARDPETGGLADAAGPAHLLTGPALQLDFATDESYAGNFGIGLCLRLNDTLPTSVRLFRIAWPEIARRC